MEPRFRTWEPDVPVCEEVMNPGSSAQHSSVERRFLAPRVVMFSVLAAAGPKRKRGRREQRRIAMKVGNNR
jgi:hypothetical protein